MRWPVVNVANYILLFSSHAAKREPEDFSVCYAREHVVEQIISQAKTQEPGIWKLW